jgi:hypothetical protein
VLATGQTQPRIPSWVPAQQRSDNRTADKTIIHSDWMRVNDVAFRKSIKDKVHSQPCRIQSHRSLLHHSERLTRVGNGAFVCFAATCFDRTLQRILVVGGGITGYHLSRSAINAGAAKVSGARLQTALWRVRECSSNAPPCVVVDHDGHAEAYQGAAL